MFNYQRVTFEYIEFEDIHNSENHIHGVQYHAKSKIKGWLSMTTSQQNIRNLPGYNTLYLVVPMFFLIVFCSNYLCVYMFYMCFFFICLVCLSTYLLFLFPCIHAVIHETKLPSTDTNLCVSSLRSMIMKKGNFSWFSQHL